MSDSGTISQITPFHTFLGSVVVRHFPLGNLRVPSSPYEDKNQDIQHLATPILLRHMKSDNAT